MNVQIQMSLGTLVSTYDYPAEFGIMKKDYTESYPDNEHVCESCHTILARKGEIWLHGQISTCPRCLPMQIGDRLMVAEIKSDDKTEYTVLVNDSTWESGFCVGLYATEPEAEFARLLLVHCKTL